MKRCVNILHLLRNKLWTEKNTKYYLNVRYIFRTYAGLIRGHWSSLIGRVVYLGDFRSLILGPNIDYDMWSGSAIVLLGENRTSKILYPANKLYPVATSIGVYPHFDHINISMAHPTRLRIKQGAKLILSPNTTILVGCYIAIAPNKELSVGAESYISHGVVINTWCGLSIGKNVMIGHESTLMDYDGHPIIPSEDKANSNISVTYGGKAAPIVIEDNVWIGFRTTILKGVRIGAGAIIGANSCVTCDIPPNSIAVGNPAKVIKENIKWQR